MELEDKSQAFGLIGVNEAGKTSILKALALKDHVADGLKNVISSKDFRDPTKPITVSYRYEFEEGDFNASMVVGGKDKLFNPSTVPHADFIFEFDSHNKNEFNFCVNAHTDAEDEAKSFIESIITSQLAEFVHKTVYWRADDRYIISNAINIDEFRHNPESISVPLRNCFKLAGVKDLDNTISRLNGDSTEVELLEETLGRAVTRHIQSKWPNHPVRITFKINENHINFHVKDHNSSAKAKTVDQRSDGFRQFISFLLTVSAESTNRELSNTLLLLDEPETHLHPKAQENLQVEIVEITKNEKKNIALYATHSNHMIDKKNLNRHIKISKPKDKTESEYFDGKRCTYSSVAYQAFDIVTPDYHSFLYSALHAIYQISNKDNKDAYFIKYFDKSFFHETYKFPLEHSWKNEKNACTVHTYIRNCIHHPENGNKYNDALLRKSIECMQEILIELDRENQAG